MTPETLNQLVILILGGIAYGILEFTQRKGSPKALDKRLAEAAAGGNGNGNGSSIKLVTLNAEGVNARLSRVEEDAKRGVVAEQKVNAWESGWPQRKEEVVAEATKRVLDVAVVRLNAIEKRLGEIEAEKQKLAGDHK